MHLTRPKSSKGRSRPPVDGSFYAADTDYSTQRSPTSPDSPSYFSRPDRNLRSQSQPIMWQTGHLSQDEVLQMLQQAPAVPPQSLNKYKVLPSIERRHSEVRGLERQTAHLHLCDHEGPHPPSISERDPKPPPDPGPEGNKESGSFGSLLLAIRAPCGRRFQQQFDPADTLLKVKASAEVRYGVQYGEASIETMDVPRRTFTDMEMTLAQCGIINKSVLCIFYNDSEGEKESG
ncbi:UBX domain-containing protein 10 [Cheilinus undulatus]|uniref:UBX domain-containing protein 10 n=1 Tax=Cheilinus undulatus TaxID=241271 RepID=UPI001BD35752|nr:UBX domain-containing protein 10 [Cheilinus undulatus]